MRVTSAPVPGERSGLAEPVVAGPDDRPRPRRGLTGAVIVVCLVTFGASLALFVTGHLGAGSHVALATLALFLLAIGAHDAIHGGALPGRRVNRVIGWVASAPLLLPFCLLERSHLSHHEGVGTATDSEMWMQGPVWQLPLRWSAILPRYYAVGFELGAWALAVTAGYVGVAAALVVAWPALLLGWLVPVQLAVMLFGVLTVYLPHGPLQGVILRVAPALTGYHDDHHAHPEYPSHQYGQVRRWRAAARP